MHLLYVIDSPFEILSIENKVRTILSLITLTLKSKSLQYGVWGKIVSVVF